jgi:hypothetical protein
MPQQRRGLHERSRERDRETRPEEPEIAMTKSN